MSRPVRLPDRLSGEIQELADSERRSFAAMTAVLLEEGLRGRRRALAGVVGATGAAPATKADSQPRDVEARTVKPDFKS